MRTKVLYLVLGWCFASSNPAMAEERANFQVTCEGNVRVEPPPGKRCQSLRARDGMLQFSWCQHLSVGSPLFDGMKTPPTSQKQMLHSVGTTMVVPPSQAGGCTPLCVHAVLKAAMEPPYLWLLIPASRMWLAAPPHPGLRGDHCSTQLIEMGCV